jgi:hypothetical protein
MFGPAHAACLAAARRDRLGYIPDKTWDARPHISTLNLTTTAAPASKVQWNGRTFNQGGFGSCGGHGTAKAERQAYLSAGYTWPFEGDNQDFSPCWFYKLARRISTPATSANGPPLTDSGIDPLALDAVVPQFGAVVIGTDGQCPAPDGTYTDCYAATVNVDAQLDAEIEGRCALDFTTYNIDASSGNADAIAAQVTPVLQTPGLANAFGIFVDSAMENWDPATGPLSTPCNLSDPSGGGHWIDQDEITMTFLNGVRCWGFLNSWDDTWGLQGRIYVTDTRLVTMTSQIIAFKANGPATPWKAAA